MRTHLTRLRATLALLLVGSGLLFAIGSTIERRQHHAQQPTAAANASGESEQSGESGGESGESSGEGATHVEQSDGEGGVKVLGTSSVAVAEPHV
ncbi:MAG TPA: hypothetical protein VN960_00760 [Gaiellaceae bacterium]|nr:hypothetical protein [Gaiellaceae bacterium]